MAPLLIKGRVASRKLMKIDVTSACRPNRRPTSSESAIIRPSKWLKTLRADWVVIAWDQVLRGACPPKEAFTLVRFRQP
jgi:hypothetical protein